MSQKITQGMQFNDKVLRIVSKIPKGATLTYKQVAQKAGIPLAYRAVGNIMSRNFGPKIPCHGVIKSNGEPGGYNRGEENKKKPSEKRRSGIKNKGRQRNLKSVMKNK